MFIAKVPLSNHLHLDSWLYFYLVIFIIFLYTHVCQSKVLGRQIWFQSQTIKYALIFVTIWYVPNIALKSLKIVIQATGNKQCDFCTKLSNALRIIFIIFSELLCLTILTSIYSRFLIIAHQILVYFSSYHYFWPKWTLYKHGSNKYKKFMSVGNFGILSVVCIASIAYLRLCRGLKFLLKIQY